MLLSVVVFVLFSTFERITKQQQRKQATHTYTTKRFGRSLSLSLAARRWLDASDESLGWLDVADELLGWLDAADELLGWLDAADEQPELVACPPRHRPRRPERGAPPNEMKNKSEFRMGFLSTSSNRTDNDRLV